MNNTTQLIGSDLVDTVLSTVKSGNRKYNDSELMDLIFEKAGIEDNGLRDYPLTPEETDQIYTDVLELGKYKDSF